MEEPPNAGGAAGVSSPAGPVTPDAPWLDDFRARVAQLLHLAKGKKRALLLTHDNPDPDSLASAWALGQLLEDRAGLECTVAYGGLIGRAENRAMVRLLKIPVMPVHRVKPEEFDVVGLVDTQPEIGNHSLPEVDLPVICIDHHPARPESDQAAYHDVGGDAGATSTLLTNYLRAAGVTPRPAVATALFYGIKSDTRDLGREVGRWDVEAYQWLIPLTDMPAVSAIEHPQLPREYFQVLAKALRRVELHGNVTVVELGRVYVPELVPEMADRLMTIDGTKWALATGLHDGSLYLSVRVSDKRMRSVNILRERLDPLDAGSSGGHGSMAGARLELKKLGRNPAERTARQRKIVAGLIEDMGGTPGAEPLLGPPRRGEEG
ncbi:MAG: DHH family phosphoesterase [Deltaproteobacteria bacterium]|nr:DHH family phosphoesterase [Deltaproteobacteria bacterium]